MEGVRRTGKVLEVSGLAPFWPQPQPQACQEGPTGVATDTPAQLPLPAWEVPAWGQVMPQAA